MKKNEYDIQAEKFLSDTNTEFLSYYTGTRPYWAGEKEERDVYSVTLKRGNNSYTFDFVDSIANTKKIKYGEAFRTKLRAYDVLACLTKYEPESNIDDFASEYGYTKISEAIRVHEAVKKEYAGISSLYSEAELEVLREIS